MKAEVRNGILLVSIVIVIPDFIDLPFNFSGLVVEKFHQISTGTSTSTDNLRTSTAVMLITQRLSLLYQKMMVRHSM